MIGTLSITGTDVSEFSIQNDNCSDQTIASSGNCTVQALVSPTSEGAKSTNLSIPSNDPDKPTLSVPLSGTGGSPDITVSPTSVDFGSVEADVTSTPQTLTVSNSGTSSLIIGTLSFTAITGAYTADFSIQNDNCSGQTITVSGNCTVQVLFSGLSPAGNRSVNLSIPSNDPDTPTLTVPLTGFSLAIPTLSEWGMVVFVLFLLFSGMYIIIYRRGHNAGSVVSH